MSLPRATPVRVTVDITCRFGTNVASVWIEATRGGSGWATAVNQNSGTARYMFELSFAGDYEVRTGCDGTADN
ncbi:hypothetical protein [Kibdelosporangium aridum]|uniref:hypothetical protein n=1 Tax=Kibdelosporangium aridum TaxID=2030 RepID=UPI0035EB3F9D